MLVALLLQAATPTPSDDAFNPRASCWREETRGTVPVIVYLGERSCVRFRPPRSFDGLWVNAFEGQRFVEGARTRAELAAARNGHVWFSTDDKTTDAATGSCPRQHLCRISFEGRAARDMARKPLEGYGHMSMSVGLVLADRIMRIEDLGPIVP